MFPWSLGLGAWDLVSWPIPFSHPVSPHFRPVSAIAHIAPAPAMILAEINEQPAAVFALALPDILQWRTRGQQFRRRPRNRTERVIQRPVLVAPAPTESFFGRRDAQAV